MNTNTITNKDNNFSKNILILGGADGIGFAISKVFEKLNYNIYVTSRYPHENTNNIKYFILEATKENSWLNFKELISKNNVLFDIIINTIGILHDDINNIYPEKSIKTLDTNFFIKNIEINSLVSALCIKHMIDFISKNKKTVILCSTGYHFGREVLELRNKVEDTESRTLFGREIIELRTKVEDTESRTLEDSQN